MYWGVRFFRMEGYQHHMTYDEMAALTRWGDTSDEAIAKRLTAARRSVMPVQKEFAAALGISATTYNSQETRGRPSMAAMSFLYRNHRIDYNFILHGDFVTLPADVQSRLMDALREND